MVPPVVHANIVYFQVAQFTVQISTASNHKPLVRRLGFIVMVAVFIMDNKRGIHNYIEFYGRAGEVRYIDKLQICIVKFNFADISDSVEAQIKNRGVNRRKKFLNRPPHLIIEVILNILLE